MKEKIPFYNIANMFFVGSVFSLFLAVIFADRIDSYSIKNYGELLSNWNMIVYMLVIVAMFEIGFIINRLGSIIIGPLYVWCDIWPKAKYDADVSEISRDNPKFQAMITELNLMRSHIMMSVCLMIISFVECKCCLGMFFLFLIVVFTLGGRKHNEKINLIRKGNAAKSKKGESGC